MAKQQHAKLTVVGGVRRTKAPPKVKSRVLSQKEIVEAYMRRVKTHAGYTFDPVFLRKCDIRIGTQLRSIGRKSGNKGTIWEVVRITCSVPGIGRMPVDEVKSLRDEVLLRQKDGTEHRNVTFSSLSYLAHWRLAE